MPTSPSVFPIKLSFSNTKDSDISSKIFYAFFIDFCTGERYGLSFSLLHVDYQFSLYRVLKSLSFLESMFWLLLQKWDDSIWVGSLLSLLFCSTYFRCFVSVTCWGLIVWICGIVWSLWYVPHCSRSHLLLRVVYISIWLLRLIFLCLWKKDSGILVGIVRVDCFQYYAHAHNIKSFHLLVSSSISFSSV
jgi:hypothetical protein